MAERILQEREEIKPGDRLTVFFKPLWVTAENVKPELVRLFSGTTFPVSTVSVDLWGEVAFAGCAHAQAGLSTTLPGRNILVFEFRDFVNARLDLLPASAAYGNVKVSRMVAGDVAKENEPLDLERALKVLAVIAAVAAGAWLISSLARILGR